MDPILHHLLFSLPLFAVALALLLAGKYVFAWTVPFKLQEQLTEKDNPAVGVCFVGYLLGLGIALAGSIFSEGELVNRLVTVGLGGGLSIVFMRLSMFINDKLILYRFSIVKEMIEDRNVGTGFVVAGSSVATGLMLNGVMTGHSEPLWGIAALGVIRDVTLYWLAGQAILVFGGWVFQLFAGYDVQGTIENDDNMACGISFCGFLVALGIICRAALANAGSNILDELTVTGCLALAGLALLVVAQVVVGRVFFSTSPLSKEVVRDKNPAAGALAGACSIGVAILLAAAVAG